MKYLIIFLTMVNISYAEIKTTNINVNAVLKYNYDIKFANNEVKTSSNNEYKNYRVIVTEKYITIEY